MIVKGDKMSNINFKTIIENGDCYLGIEFGSTRIKGVLINADGNVVASGSHDWENHLENGIWTYPLQEVWDGLQDCYKKLAKNVEIAYEAKISNVKAIGISAMMHGYLPFDENGNQLAEFRTWRNNITEESAAILTELFNYNIPQRWSIAHLYQAILNDESHVKDINYLTTLAGYVHWKLTGQKVVGVGEASGMFPISIKTHNYDISMMNKFNNLIADKNYPWSLNDILPKTLVAGEHAGNLTEEGAKLIDPSGELKAGALACPPEGDAGTGMVATNSLAVRTGNISAGTSAFAMVVLENDLKTLHRELDMVTTPAGDLVAMSHANNCTTEINAWVKLFKEFLEIINVDKSDGEIYSALFNNSLKGEKDCDGIVPYCFHSGEDIVGLAQGCPSLIHPTTSNFNLANFIKAQLYTCFAAMKIGIDILVNEEGAKIDKMVGHGGIFTTPVVAQSYLAAAIGAQVDVINTASEGGAWGIALLAAYADIKQNNDISLNDYINKIFENADFKSYTPSEAEIKGYDKFIENFKKYLPVEKQAVKISN